MKNQNNLQNLNFNQTESNRPLAPNDNLDINKVQKYPSQTAMNQTPMMGQQFQPGQPYQQGQPFQPGQPVQPMLFVPVFGNFQYTFTQDPLTELGMSIGATIRQQPELLEIITGCETENRYHVFVTLANGMQKYLFKCKEQSTCCQRQCCPADLREFNMVIKHIGAPEGFQQDFSEYFAKLEKPYKCTCLCLARPKITGAFQKNNQTFGEVKEEFTCCDPLFVISNQSGIRYYITIDCCQCGFICRKSCSKFYNVDCIIREGGIDGPAVGTIKKRIVTSMMELMGDADTYYIEFPVNATPEEKLSLIMAGLFIDYRYYETNAGSDHAQRSRGGRSRRHTYRRRR